MAQRANQSARNQIQRSIDPLIWGQAYTTVNSVAAKWIQWETHHFASTIVKEGEDRRRHDGARGCKRKNSSRTHNHDTPCQEAGNLSPGSCGPHVEPLCPFPAPQLRETRVFSPFTDVTGPGIATLRWTAQRRKNRRCQQSIRTASPTQGRMLSTARRGAKWTACSQLWRKSAAAVACGRKAGALGGTTSRFDLPLFKHFPIVFVSVYTQTSVRHAESGLDITGTRYVVKEPFRFRTRIVIRCTRMLLFRAIYHLLKRWSANLVW